MLLLLQANVSAQHAEDGDHRFMIHPAFVKTSDFSTGISSIHLNIIKGKYKEASRSIRNLQKGNRSAKENAALLCYEANIAYNESQYEHSIDLCEKVISSLNQKSAEREARDGMVMSLFVFDPTKEEVHFALENHRFFLIRENECSEIKGDRFPIGAYGDEHISFHVHALSLKKGDKLISFTDGVTDQFGGPKHKKFGIAQMRTIIEQDKSQSVEFICQKIRKSLDKWSEDQEQTDDITLIGMEI
jgi:serine phosphatase RsbU (regulator of sigma subunit)